MRAILFLLIFLFGCKTTKRIESSKTRDAISFNKEFKSGLDEIKRTEDLSELITKKTTIRTIPHKKETGEEIFIQEQVVEEKTERFNKKTEAGKFESEVITETDLDEKETTYDLDRETEGQEVAADISKGITEGLFKALFGDVVKKITAFVLLALFIFFVIVIRRRKKSNP